MASIIGYTKTKIDSLLSLLAPLASPAFTGGPTAPTAVAGDNDGSLATTAFVQGEKLTVFKVQAATAYTLILTDAGKHLESSNAAAQAITVPPNSAVAFLTGTVIRISQFAAGKASVVAGAGVTISSPGSLLGCRVIWSTITLTKTGTDTWLLSGDVG